jgi:hypothetical protein
MESNGASVNTAVAVRHSQHGRKQQMNITRWEPFREVEEMFRQYSPFFSRALRRNGGEAGAWTQ